MRMEALLGQMEQLMTSIVILIGKQENLITSAAHEIAQQIVEKIVQLFLECFPMILNGLTYHVHLS